MTVDEEERKRIKEQTKLEARVEALERQTTVLFRGILAIASAIGLSIWNTLSGGIFK